MSDVVLFDHLSPEIVGPQFWDAVEGLRSHGPLVRVESHGGFWAATSYDMVLRIAQDWETFSSARGILFPGRPSPDVMPYMMPIDIDPPRQRSYRKQVNPHLTPKKVAVHEESIREIADELIDSFIDQGSCDLAVDFARKFPGTVFFRLIVRSSDEEFRRVEPSARVMTFDTDQERRAAAGADLRAWAARTLEARSGQPEHDDVVNAVMHLHETGTSFADHEYLSGLHILAQGGIGTSASAIAAAMKFVCEDPDIQQRVGEDLSLVPALMEEALRLEPPLPMMFRTVARDVEIGGQELKEGDWVCLLFGAANRDPDVFDRADEFDLDRPHHRLVSFGAGPHRCIGSNLARLQIRVALEQLVSRLRPCWIPEGATLEYASHQARGLSSMPIEFAPS